MKTFKVLVTENIAQEGIDMLRNDPEVEVHVKVGMKRDRLKESIGEYDAVITRSGTPVSADLIANPGRLKIIGRAGVGVDNIDIEAASKKGIIVMNAPTGNTLAATELTLGIMLAAARKIPVANDSLIGGRWYKVQSIGGRWYKVNLLSRSSCTYYWP